ncbi:MAG: LysR family transcriptional regulator [Eubacteriales bacterium]
MYNPQLETFIAVADSGSFTKAAETLFISSTAVMKQINSLEKRLGISLFLRTNHGLQLTESGKSLLQDAKYLMDYSARAIEKAREIENKEKNQTIRIGTSIMTPAKFLLDIWDEIHLYDKNLKIELIPFENNPVNSVEILRNLGKHIDIVAGLYDDDFLNERGCLAAHLYDKRILLAVPINHPLGKKDRIGLGDLKNHRVMVIRKGWNTYIDALREELTVNGVTIEDFSMFNINAYNQAVKENIPIITAEGWEDVHPLLKLVPTDWTHKIPFGIFYSPSPSRQVKKFIDIVQKVARK